MEIFKMRINFRQGLVRVPTNFLNLSGGKVSLVIPSADTLVATFADGSNDYLITERISVTDAWTGPFTAGNNYWLFFDINPTTGVRTFGHTILAPIETAQAPTNPQVGQCWFDTSTTTFKVWYGSSWIRKIRVFAAQLNSGAVFVSLSINSPVYTGTQVGILDGVNINTGALVFDAASGNPIKKSDGTFFTTEDLAVTGIASSSHVKFGSIVIEAEAQSNIPSYSIVRFVDFNKVVVANNYLIDNGTYGIVDYSTTTGNVVNVTMEGLIENLAWDWTSAGINAPLYVDVNGHLTTSVPPTPIVVAAVIDKHTILLRPSSLFLNNSNDPATPTNPGSVKISVAAVDVNDPIVVGDNDPRISSINPHVSDMDIHLTPNENTFLDALVSYSGGMVAMTNAHSGITRTLTAPAAGIAITNGDGVAGNPAFLLANDLAAVEGLGATGLTARTATDTWTTRSLQAPSQGFTITYPDAVGGNPTFVLANDLAAVEGLTTEGIAVRTNSGWQTRTLTAPAAGITVTNGDGVAGNPTLVLANDLAELEGLTTTGAAFRTSTGWHTRTLTAPTAGFTITNPAGDLGDPTFVLANDLAQIEGLVTTGFAVRTNNSPEIWTTRSITAASGQTTITNPDGNSGNVIVGLPNVGSPVTAMFEKFTTDAQGRISATTVVTPTDITTALAYTPVNKAGDTMSGLLILSADPSAALGAATKQYVDNLASGLDPKGSVTVATTAPITLANNQSIDGIAVTTGKRVLVKDQADQTTNGVYDVVAAGAWTRSVDAIPGTTLNAGAYFFVEQGTTYAESGWVLTTDNPVSGASLIVFQQFSGAGQITAGTGLSKTGNTLAVITPTPGNISINGSGVDLTATGITPGIYRSLTVDTYGRITSATNPTTLSGYGIVDGQPLDADLTAISAFSSTGFAVRNTDTSWSQRSITGTANQIVVTNGAGDGANPNLSLPSTYVQFPGTDALFVPNGTTAQSVTTINGGLRYDSTTNNMRMVEGSSWRDIGTVRTLAFTNPSEGIVLSGVLAGSTYTITTALANDLQAIEALNSTGLAARTGANTWAQRTLAGTTGHITVSNGDGVSGNPTFELATSGVTANTYTKVTVDIYGRVTSAVVPGAVGANSLADYGLTAAAQPLATNLTNLGTYNTNGILCYTGTNTFTGRQFVATVGTTANNLTVTNPQGIAGDITLTFSNDLGAFLAAQSSTGFSARTAATTWAQRQITGTSNRVSVVNGAGIAGDPIIDIDATYVGQGTITTVGTITTGVWNGTPITPVKGGTGISSNGTIDQFLSVSHTNATVWEYKTLSGTSNQVTVTHAAGSTTLSLPQSINTTADVAFNSVNAPIVKSAILTLTDAANISWNMALGINATATLTANRTLDNPTNLQAGAVVVLKVVQDAGGAHTLAYGTAYKWVGGSAPTVAAGANAVSILTFLCDGTNLYEMARALAVA